MEMKGLGLFARFPSTLLQTDNRPVSSSDSCLKTNNYAYVNYQACEGAERLQPTDSLSRIPNFTSIFQKHGLCLCGRRDRYTDIF